METVLAILTGLGVGVSLTMVIFRPRRTHSQWPDLIPHEASYIVRPASDIGSSDPSTISKPDFEDALEDTDNFDLCEDNADIPLTRLDTNSQKTGGYVNESTNLIGTSLLSQERPSQKDNNNLDVVTREDGSVVKTLVPPEERPRRVLFVIAHPDDECMFFGPAIMHFIHKEKALVFLICLSDGSYESSEIGRIRQKELWDSCRILGIPESNITLYKCKDLPDDPQANWPIHSTCRIIKRHLLTLQCDMVVTFDGGGVSGHPNHCSLGSALLHMVTARLLPPGCHPYTLDSVNIFRKYSSIFDLPTSLLLSPHTICINRDQHRTIKAAMRAHASQYVWFRRLYMIFSRYVVINSLSPVTNRRRFYA